MSSSQGLAAKFGLVWFSSFKKRKLKCGKFTEG
jgi:hypothetical protein